MKPDSTFIDRFHGVVTSMIDEEGMRIPHGTSVHENGLNSLLAIAMQKPMQGYATILGHIAKCLKDPEELGPVREVAFGWDRYSKPGQGNRYKDLITVHYLDLRTAWIGAAIDPRAWRFGVIDYVPPKDGQEKVVEAINWDNEFWNHALRKECEECMAIIGRKMMTGRTQELFT